MTTMTPIESTAFVVLIHDCLLLQLLNAEVDEPMKMPWLTRNVAGGDSLRCRCRCLLYAAHGSQTAMLVAS
jgi:hypothetical protein